GRSMIMNTITTQNRLKAKLRNISVATATMMSLCAAGFVRAQQPDGKGGTATNPAPAAVPAVAQTNAVALSADTNLVTMNFHGTSLEEVLVQLSETAGFTINIKPGTTVRGKVDLFSGKPMTKEQALDWLDRVLNQNGLGAIRNGTELTIVDKAEIK